MAAIRRRDTAAERRIRSLLHQDGLRFRVDFPIRVGRARPIRPDVVFQRARLAVFIDGCFWHGCPHHGRRESGKNSEYWGPKISRNRERDAEQIETLRGNGWSVLRVWEHTDPEDAAASIKHELIGLGYAPARRIRSSDRA